MDGRKVAKIVLVSSGQPSLNPRLVKEADALAGAGYDVTVLYNYWNSWGTALDEQMLPQKKWKAIRIGGDPLKERSTYQVSRIIHKAAKFLAFKLGLRSFTEPAGSRGSYFLLRGVKKYKADLYIGHNLGALPAVVAAAKLNNAPVGFDAEDFHRREAKDDPKLISYNKARYLENKYFPTLGYLTASSPLIAEEYQKLYPRLTPVSIRNVFPTALKHLPKKVNSGTIRLFWFSQTIGPDRGIEVIVKALGMLPHLQFELHLLGDASFHGQFIIDLKQTFNNVHIHRPIPQDDIIKFASQFDIGIASENNVPFNHDICLANKIFTYLQAGLAVLASDTTAQKQFMTEHRAAGQWYHQGDAEGVAKILSDWAADRQLIMQQGLNAFDLATREMNWEQESKIFLQVVEQTLAR